MRTNQSFLTILLFTVSVFNASVTNAIPAIQSWKTDNGVKVLFVETKSLPMVDIRITFDAGSARDGKLSGLASLTNGLLVEGAAGLSAQEIAENFESVGAQISTDSLRDMAIVGVRTLTEEKYLNVAITTLKKVLTKPDFLPRAFKRDLASMKVSVQAGKQSPSSIAEHAFYKAIYGEHPYSTPIGGTDESLAAIELSDVVDFYKQFYVANNAQIVIVGAVSQALAFELANSLVSGLPSGVKPAPIPPVEPLAAPKTVRIKFPSKQSHILVGQPGTKRGDVDYFSLYLANHPFGGSGFASRLVDQIREERGLAYSVYSYFTPMREKGPFTMGMQTKAEQTQEALDLLNSELQAYIKKGPTDAELKSSVSNIVGSFPLNLDGNSKLLGYLAMIGFYDLPLSYLQDFVSNVKAVTLNDIKRALKERLHTDKLVTVVVGREG